MWIKREIEQYIRKLSGQRPCLVISGPRQSGKTSLLKHLFPKHNFVSLDLPRHAEQAEESGEAFLDQHTAPLILDEIQYAPKIFRYLKAKIDASRNANGLYLMTGSQKFNLMANVSESLAGRVGIIECYSLSAREWQHHSKTPLEGNALLQWILQGGYPELHAKNLEPEQYYSDYLVTYLERDVRQLIQVRNLRDFDRFIRLCALRSGQLLSMHSMAGDIGISTNTLKSWIAILETSGIISLLEPYFNNHNKRLIKTPKLYLTDTGLLCYLAGIHTVSELRQSGLLGSIFETHTFGQLLRHFNNQGKKQPLYFYRDHDGHEVDFVISKGNALHLIECKWAENPDTNLKSFIHLKKILGEKNILSERIIRSIVGSMQKSNGIILDDSVNLDSFKNLN